MVRFTKDAAKRIGHWVRKSESTPGNRSLPTSSPPRFQMVAKFGKLEEELQAGNGLKDMKVWLIDSDGAKTETTETIKVSGAAMDSGVKYAAGSWAVAVPTGQTWLWIGSPCANREAI